MKLLVFGGRDYRDLDQIRAKMREIHARRPITLVIHGGAEGADVLAGVVAKELGVRVEVFPAKWKIHGRAAGPIRNTEMLERGKPEAALGFPGGNGTHDMAKKVRAVGIPLELVAASYDDSRRALRASERQARMIEREQQLRSERQSQKEAQLSLGLSTKS